MAMTASTTKVMAIGIPLASLETPQTSFSCVMLFSAASRTVYGSPSIVRLSADTGSAYPHARSNTYPRRPYASMGCYAHARGTNPNTGCNTDSWRTDNRGRYGSGRPRYAAFRHADRFAIDNRTGRRRQER